MSIEQNIKICNLIDTYGNLLSQKQLKLLKHYYFEDMSLSEIAEVEKISRPAVLDALHSGVKKLENCEEKVGMLDLKQKLNACILAEDTKTQLIKILEEI